MKNNQLPLEEQVIPLGTAKELAELLEGDALGSLWVWAETRLQRGWWLITMDEYKKAVVFDTIGKKHFNQWYKDKYYPAYTGDELGVLLGKVRNLPDYPVSLTVQDKANLAIQGLREGWIKKENFNYEKV